MSKADRKLKKIAGLKLPKSIRRAPAIRSLLASKAGRKILNDAFMAGAAVAAQRVMEAHEAAKSKAAGKKVVKFEKKAKAEKAPNVEQVAEADPVDEVEHLEQIAEQFETEEPIVTIAKRKPARRSKATKSAPDAAPVDDVVPTAVEELIPDADEAEPMVDEPVSGGSEEVEDLRVRPGAAD